MTLVIRALDRLTAPGDAPIILPDLSPADVYARYNARTLRADDVTTITDASGNGFPLTRTAGTVTRAERDGKRVFDTAGGVEALLQTMPLTGLGKGRTLAALVHLDALPTANAVLLRSAAAVGAQLVITPAGECFIYGGGTARPTTPGGSVKVGWNVLIGVLGAAGTGRVYANGYSVTGAFDYTDPAPGNFEVRGPVGLGAEYADVALYNRSIGLTETDALAAALSAQIA